MLVTTADFHANMDKYLAMVHYEDNFITADGKPIAQMTAPQNKCCRLSSRIAEGSRYNDEKHTRRKTGTL